MEKEELKEIIRKLEKINVNIKELKAENGYLIDELNKNATIDDKGVECDNINKINTKISNIKVDIKGQIIPKIKTEIS